MPHKVVKDLRGDIIAPYDLPKPNSRWNSQRKSVVVLAVQAGMVSLEDILNRYSMTQKEFRIWEEELRDNGASGLQVTKHQQNKRKKKGEGA